MSGTGGRDTGGNGPVVAIATQVSGPGIIATGGATSGVGVIATGTGTGSGVLATGGSTGNGVSAVGTGAAAVLATNTGAAEALKVAGDAVSVTAVSAPFFVVPIQNQPSGTHAVGHMYVTSGGVLKICTVAGTPGTWVSVGTQT